MEAELKWKEGMAFEAKVRDHTFILDAQSGAGGKNLGPTPKETVLTSVMGCSAMDVAGLMRKFHLTPTSFTMNSVAHPRDDHPKIFTDFQVNYFFEGVDLPKEKLIEAVQLSMTRYCGVSAMVAATVKITYEIFLNKEKIHADEARFSL